MKAMLHANREVTLRYIQFLEETEAQEFLAQEFGKDFTGLSNRDWTKLRV